MKIVLAHNFYGSEAPSGENHVYLEESRLLREAGHHILEFTRNSDEIRAAGYWGMIRGGLSTPWNPFAAVKLRQLIKREQPDVLHVHNVFPLLSPAILHAAAGLPTAIVLTLHNYRLFCAAGIPMRDNQVCTRCLDEHSVLPALRYGCYRGSRTATVPLAAMISLHRRLGTWHRTVDAFIALTPFQRDTMVGAGLPKSLVKLKPHFYRNPPSPVMWSARDHQVVYVGRLGAEKGVEFLIRAWQLWGEGAPRLDLIGDGPERGALEEMVRASGQGRYVSFRGQLSFSETQRHISRARLLVIPSLSFEGFPMVIREAYALGVPVAGSRLGSIPGIVVDGKTGRLFRPGDALDLYRTLRELWDAPLLLEQMGKRARTEFEARYTAERNHATLMEIYQSALRVRHARLHGGSMHQ